MYKLPGRPPLPAAFPPSGTWIVSPESTPSSSFKIIRLTEKIYLFGYQIEYIKKIIARR